MCLKPAKFYSRIAETIQERNGWVDAIYLDFKKAFDKVPHPRLIWKLRHVGGIQGPLLKWMENFLVGRKMRTVVRGTESSWRNVLSGVPQGSVLAPIMFLIYINDIAEGISPTSYLDMFADDAKISKKVTDINSCKELQEDIDKLHTWSEKWKMDFNP